jgi:hypothetical protein
MARIRVVGIREEAPDEASLRRWFAKQPLAAPDTLDAAARLIVSLVSGLLTILFGVLAVAADPMPAYLSRWPIRLLGVLSVLFLLGGLFCALVAVLPRRMETDAARPKTQAKAFDDLVQRKAGWLTSAVITFGLGIVFLGVALIAVLLIA